MHVARPGPHPLTAQLIFYGVGTIVGAGIYTIIGSAAGLAGSALWVSILAVFVAVHAAVIVLRYKSSGRERPLRGPLAVGRMPLLPPLGIAICLALMTRFEAVVYAVTAAGVAFAILVYGVRRWRP